MWRAAAVTEQRFADPAAMAAAEVIEERLRQMYPHPMRGYDQARAAGASRATAMPPAAEQMARTAPSRPHGWRRSPALDPASSPIGTDAFAGALSDERIRLATGVDLRDYLDHLNRLGAGGQAAARALRQALASRAAQALAQAATDAATTDNPTTPGVDEHLQVGLTGSTVEAGAAQRDHRAARTSTAVEVASRWYPQGINSPTAPPRPKDPPPAPTTPGPTPTRTPRRNR